MGDYSYLPLYGPLSGDSFEAQTTAFFEGLDKKTSDKFAANDVTIGQFRTQVSSALVGVQNNEAEIAALRALVAEQVATIAALEARIRELEENAFYIDPDWTE